jgi:hypothetical protein
MRGFWVMVPRRICNEVLRMLSEYPSKGETPAPMCLLPLLFVCTMSVILSTARCCPFWYHLSLVVWGLFWSQVRNKCATIGPMFSSRILTPTLVSCSVLRPTTLHVSPEQYVHTLGQYVHFSYLDFVTCLPNQWKSSRHIYCFSSTCLCLWNFHLGFPFGLRLQNCWTHIYWIGSC